MVALAGIFLAGVFLLNFLGGWVEDRPMPGLAMAGEEHPGEAAARLASP